MLWNKKPLFPNIQGLITLILFYGSELTLHQSSKHVKANFALRTAMAASSLIHPFVDSNCVCGCVRGISTLLSCGCQFNTERDFDDPLEIFPYQSSHNNIYAICKE